MALSPSDIEQFIEIVRKDPNLRQRVFRAIAEEELLALPARLTSLTEEWERRMSRIETILQEVAERQARTEQEIAAFREATERRFQKVEQEIAAFREATERRFQRVEADLSSLVGWQWEEHYTRHIYAYFGQYLRGLRLLRPSDLDTHVQDVLSAEEVKDLYQADVLARGRLRAAPDGWIYLVMEVSRVIDEGDVARSRRRADLVRKAGLPCLAAVGGERITDAARLEARHSRVVVALDGEMQEGWEEALALSTPGQTR